MKQVVLNIPESEYNFFMKLIENLSFTKVEAESKITKNDVLESVKQGFEELKQYKQGKLKLNSAKSLLDEL